MPLVLPAYSAHRLATQCKDTALVANGGFLTCPTCALAITRQALLQEALNLCLATEPQ
jgi:hypothetical protein